MCCTDLTVHQYSFRYYLSLWLLFPKAVSRVGHGSDVLRVPGSQAKFLPQGADEVDDAARSIGPILTPYPGIEVVFREHDTRIAGKEVDAW